MGGKCVPLVGYFILFSVGGMLLVHADELYSHPTGFDSTSDSVNETYAFDEEYGTFLHLNVSDGNLSYFAFNTSSRPDGEPLYVVDLIFDIEVSGVVDDEWEIRYSDDNGTSQYVLRAFSSDNLARQNITFVDIAETGDGVWVWSEIKDGLKVMIAGLNDSAIDGGMIRIYEQRIRVGYDDEAPLVSLVSPQNDSVWQIASWVLFNFSVDDNMSVAVCDLYINGTGVDSQESPPKGQMNTFNITLENKDYYWSVNCSDENGLWAKSGDQNITIDANRQPLVIDVEAPEVVIPQLGGLVELLCNASVSDLDGMDDVVQVKATFFHDSSFDGASDESSYHLSNASCGEVYDGGSYRNYSCGFSVWYYARPGNWTCNVTVLDANGTSGFGHGFSNVSELFAMDVSPVALDFGSLGEAENSTEDVIMTVENVGNMAIDIGLFGYGVIEGDGLAMNCSEGDISIGYERYSLSTGLVYSIMTSLTSSPVTLGTFDLETRNDTYSPTRDVYWKMGIPWDRGGLCSGYVVVSLLPG